MLFNAYYIVIKIISYKIISNDDDDIRWLHGNVTFQTEVDASSSQNDQYKQQACSLQIHCFQQIDDEITEIIAKFI